MLSFSGHESNDVMIFTVEESKVGDGAASQREWLYNTVSTREDPRFVVDLSDIPYMASSDIGVLITLKRRIDGRKGKLVIANVDPYIVDTLRTMRIDKLFNIVADMPAAFAALSTS